MSTFEPKPGGPKRQHYVPQFLLRYFSQDDRIWVLDKRTDKTWRARVSDVALENYFYETTLESGERFSLEETMSRFESICAPAVAKVVAGSSIQALSANDRFSVLAFVALQKVRTPRMVELNKVLISEIKKRVPNPEDQERLHSQVGPLTDEAAKAHAILSVTGLTRDIIPHLQDKVWVLLRAYPGTTFYLSDCPVVVQNEIKNPHYGNLGLACLGIELYLPLTPSTCLAGFCSSTAHYMATRTVSLRRAMATGRRMDCSPQHMQRLNWLQIVHSERFIFSRSEDFSLARHVINEHPHRRQGLRPTVD